MRFKIIFILFFTPGLFCNFAIAQEPVVDKDSTHLNENIETHPKQSKFTKFMHGIFFRRAAPTPEKKDGKKKIYKKLIQKSYSAFEGKIIRHINIITLDPFGKTIGDTIIASSNFLVRTGNKLHVKSKQTTIRNLLVIRQNQAFDSLLVKESERLVRSQPYVRDVSFFVNTVSTNSDSVDIFIRELDTWTILPEYVSSPSRKTIRLTEKNLLGLGHEFKNTYTWYPETGNDAFATKYFVPNIHNTYINATLIYGTDEFGDFTKSLSVGRPFFSPFTKWAGGVSISQEFRTDSIQTTDRLIILQRFKFNAQDYWGGYAFQLFKGNTEKARTTKLISAIRFMRIRYLEKPADLIDTLHVFSNDDFYLASIGISTRKYVQDKYIFRFGITEDIPIGKVFSLTSGYLHKNNQKQLYVGGRISLGHYFPWGYLTSNFEYGSIIHDFHTEKGILIAGANYFTGLIEIGKWKFRQFVKTQFDIGLNRLPYESLTLNDGNGIDGFNSPVLTGVSRWIFRLQTQSYAPWDFIGFRFGPYFVCSLGMVGDAATGFTNSTLYSQIGLGILIKNEYLIVNTFDISIAFYPIIPGNGQNIFKFNSFKTTDFGFRDFEIGKPAAVLYH
ncbi:MAG: hypothetical protein RQ761_03680 [Bacteroidales bacterium]|nr:hypothetical protein [Bacteroidales bacterium]